MTTLLIASRVIGLLLSLYRARKRVEPKRFFDLEHPENALYETLIQPDTFLVIEDNAETIKKMRRTCAGMPCYRAYFGLNAPCEGCPALPLIRGETGHKLHTSQVPTQSGALVTVSAEWVNVNGIPLIRVSR